MCEIRALDYPSWPRQLLDRPDHIEGFIGAEIRSDSVIPDVINGRSYELALYLSIHGLTTDTVVTGEVNDGRAYPIGMIAEKQKVKAPLLAMSEDGWFYEHDGDSRFGAEAMEKAFIRLQRARRR